MGSCMSGSQNLCVTPLACGFCWHPCAGGQRKGNAGSLHSWKLRVHAHLLGVQGNRTPGPQDPRSPCHCDWLWGKTWNFSGPRFVGLQSQVDRNHGVHGQAGDPGGSWTRSPQYRIDSYTQNHSLWEPGHWAERLALGGRGRGGWMGLNPGLSLRGRVWTSCAPPRPAPEPRVLGTARATGSTGAAPRGLDTSRLDRPCQPPATGGQGSGLGRTGRQDVLGIKARPSAPPA